MTKKHLQLDLKFSAIDHSADYAALSGAKRLRRLYSDLRQEGIKSVHYDWHWKRIEPEPGNYNRVQLARYKMAKDQMKKAGLEPPAIILSNPPRWAVRLYKKDKEKFFTAYKKYIEEVRKYLETDFDFKIEKIQILNELNNFVYNPIAAEDLPKLCRITRKVFFEYNPDIKLAASMLVGNLTPAFRLGIRIDSYLKKFEKIKDNFDIISLNYFPGLWYWPIREAGWKYKSWFGQLGKLQEVFRIVSGWGFDYELGEVGFPTNGFWGNEEKQVRFYESFFDALRPMLEDLKNNGARLPCEICFFEASDEEPENCFGKIIGKNFSPEYNFGLFRSDGKRKLILQETPDPPGEKTVLKSRLGNILNRFKSKGN